MKINKTTIAELRARLAKASIRLPLEWEKLRIEDDDGEEFVFVSQGSYLGTTLINLGDTYEHSGEDCLLIQEALNALPALLDTAERVAGLEEQLHLANIDAADESAERQAAEARLEKVREWCATPSPKNPPAREWFEIDDEMKRDVLKILDGDQPCPRSPSS